MSAIDIITLIGGTAWLLPLIASVIRSPTEENDYEHNNTRAEIQQR